MNHLTVVVFIGVAVLLFPYTPRIVLLLAAWVMRLAVAYDHVLRALYEPRFAFLERYILWIEQGAKEVAQPTVLTLAPSSPSFPEDSWLLEEKGSVDRLVAPKGR